MTHTYTITGMTCTGCEASVKNSLLKVPGVTAAEVSRQEGTATVTMEKHISLSVLQGALDKKYSIIAATHNEAAEQARELLTVYKPVLLILAYLLIISVTGGIVENTFSLHKAMNIFMAGFFLTFSFFKLLNLKGFAESYSMYDLVAKRIKGWGYVYPFTELALGISYATGFMPFITNIVTLVVMSLSIVGVLQSVLNKRRIQCACLGVIFNLPVSTVTLIEDALMIIMSGIMLLSLI